MNIASLREAAQKEGPVAKRLVSLLNGLADEVEKSASLGTLDTTLAELRANAQTIADAMEPQKEASPVRNPQTTARHAKEDKEEAPARGSGPYARKK
jgi:hypothetical protein